LSAVFITGCAASIVGNSLQAQDILALNNKLSATINVMSVGDVLTLKFYHNPKLNDEVTIRADGNITLQLIGDIAAVGLTPPQLAARINEEYSKIFMSSTEKYFLGVGDQLSIKFYFHRDLNEDLVIRPDGKISLQLAGEVPAAGLTPGQLNSNLKEIYSKILSKVEVSVIIRDFKIPAVSVTVKEFGSHKVYVGGEVARPGMVPLRGLLRTFDAITQAGGSLNTAELATVVLLRYDGTPKPVVYSLDLNSVLSGDLPDVQLKPYDIVFVPKSAIARVDLFVEQHLNQLIPRTVTFPITYSINPEVRIKQ